LTSNSLLNNLFLTPVWFYQAALNWNHSHFLAQQTCFCHLLSTSLVS